HQSASQPIQETLERRTSSPAAPPPSSVIGLIDPTHRTSQQPDFEKTQKRDNRLIFMKQL
ncbi:hypothetical protein, partial [Rhizobium sp. NPDC092014]|uniref:hypothetical protein n=1 Tax=Rhizobium sp. NPDC092014 TaxID=3364501 RepID=UPI0037FA0664